LQTDKKKLLILIDWFFPGYKAGGPIRSCVNLVIALKDTYEVFVLTTDTDHGEIKPYEGIASNCWINDFHPAIHIYYARKKTLSLKQLENEISTVQADYVYLNHLFSPYFVIYPLWLKYVVKIKSKLIVCPRGALYDSALSVKSYKKKPFLFLFRLMGIHKKVLFHATNEREKKAIQHYFPGSEIIIADNLPNLNQPAFASCIKLTGEAKCIFISRVVPIKNILFLLEALEKVKASVELTIIGPVEDESYWDQCKKKIKQLPANIKVEYCGTKKNEELFIILQQHHLFVLPTTGENFGHAIFEAFLAGRPVLISDQTPWLKLADRKAGWDVPLDQPEYYTSIIEKIASWDQQQYDEYAMAAWQYAKHFISNPALIEQYNNLFS